MTIKKQASRLSLRLGLWYGTGVLLLIVIFVGAVMVMYPKHQDRQVRLRLEKAGENLLQNVELDEGEPYLTPAWSDDASIYQQDGAVGLYVRLISPYGEVWEQSANFEGRPTFDPLLPDVAAEFTELTWQQRKMQALYLPVLAEEEVVAWLEVSSFVPALPYRQFMPPVMLALVLALLVALGLGYVLARRTGVQVQRLVDALGPASSSGVKPVPEKPESVDFGLLCQERLPQWQTIADPRKVVLHSRIKTAAHVEVTRAALMTLADEIVEEAIVRSPEGGAIGITVEGQEGTVVLAVHDEGTMSREDVAAQMGLARSMAEAVGGTVRIEKEQGYVVEVRFPEAAKRIHAVSR